MRGALRCPWCRTGMVAEPLGRIEIDRCDRCGARWFDRTELAAAMAARTQPIQPSWGTAQSRADGTGWPACPRDGGDLAGYQWLGAELGRCRTCRGVLIDDAGWRTLIGVAADAARSSAAGSTLTALDTVIQALTFIPH